MNVYISTVLFLLFGLFLFLALYDSGSTSLSTGKTPKPSSNEDLSSDDNPSPNILMNLGTAGSIITGSLETGNTSVSGDTSVGGKLTVTGTSSLGGMTSSQDIIISTGKKLGFDKNYLNTEFNGTGNKDVQNNKTPCCNSHNVARTDCPSGYVVTGVATSTSHEGGSDYLKLKCSPMLLPK